MKLRIECLLVVFIFFMFGVNMGYTADSLTIKLNGHAYRVEDIFSKKIKEIYNRNRNIIQDSMLIEIENAQPNINVTNLELPPPDSIFVFYSSYNDTIKLKAYLNNINVDFQFKEGYCRPCNFYSHFDLSIFYIGETIIDSLNYKIRFHSPTTNVTDFYMNGKPRQWYQYWNWVICEGCEWAAENFGNVEGKIERQISKALTDTTFKVLKFTDFTGGLPVDPGEIEALENSFPMNGRLTVDLKWTLWG